MTSSGKMDKEYSSWNTPWPCAPNLCQDIQAGDQLVHYFTLDHGLTAQNFQDTSMQAVACILLH